MHSGQDVKLASWFLAKGKEQELEWASWTYKLMVEDDQEAWGAIKKNHVWSHKAISGNTGHLVKGTSRDHIK